MAIEFNNIGNSPIHNRAKQERADRDAVSNAAESHHSAAQKQIQLSEQAQQLKSTGSDVSIDQAKVDRIRSEIAEGRYHVDPVRLAETFIALESELSQV